MANSARRYAAAHATEARVLVEADSCIEAAIAYAETCACEDGEWVVTVNDAETGNGCVLKLDLNQHV